MPSEGLPQNQVQNQPQNTTPQAPADLSPPTGDERLLPDEGGVEGDGAPMDSNFGDEVDMESLEGPSPLGGPLNLSLGSEPIGSSLDGQALDLEFDSGELVTEGDADAQYRAGYDAVVQGDYAFAEAQFRQFVALFPNHPLAPDATNWLGEALLQREEYDNAAQVLFDGFQRYETSTRAPDLLLKLGIALAGAGERDTACRTFTEVLKRFPNNGGAFDSRVAQEQAAAQC